MTTLDASARPAIVGLGYAVPAAVRTNDDPRFTWLQEDFPRNDGALRRPLPFNRRLDRKPAFFALQNALRNAPERKPLWIPPKARRHP